MRTPDRSRLLVRALPLVLVLGCTPGLRESTERSLIVAARAVAVADADFAPRYERARIEAREASSSWEELDARIAAWERARLALVTAHSAIVAADAVMQAADEESVGTWVSAWSRVAESLSALRAALHECGVDPPPRLSKAEAALRRLTRSIE